MGISNQPIGQPTNEPIETSPVEISPASSKTPVSSSKTVITPDHMVKIVRTPSSVTKADRSSLVRSSSSNESEMAVPRMFMEMRVKELEKTVDNLAEKAILLKSTLSPLKYAKIEKEISSLRTMLQEENIEMDFSDAFEELEEKINQLHRINSMGTTISSSSTASAKHIANGAVKQVWEKEGVTTKVFYTALASNSSAEAELRTETQTMQDIGKSLETNVLKDFVSPLKLSKKSDHFASHFPNVKALKAAVETSEHHAHIPDEDLAILKTYFESSQGQKAANQAMERGKHVALEARVLSSDESIGGQYTVETTRADGDLETLLRNPDLYTSEDLIDISLQVIKGMADLQKAGYVHGDLKPENVLVVWENGKWVAKISDFGKAMPMSPTSIRKHIGNTRFAPWENRLSMKGDVCSTGIKLIRILEQQVLTHKRKTDSTIRSLITPTNPGYSKAANVGKKVREGFEVFVIESRDFNAIEADHTKSQKVRNRLYQGYNMFVNNTSAQNKKIGEEKDRYIDALASGLKEINFAPPKAIEQLCGLIKTMTSIDANDRPTMEEAEALFEELTPTLLNKKGVSE